MDELLGTKTSVISRLAAEVLRCNDVDRRTRATPELHPQQWSWDTVFQPSA